MIFFHFKFLLAWVSEENFPGGTTSTFCSSFSSCWRCNANGRSQNLYCFFTTMEMPRVTETVTKIALRWQK